MHRGLEVPDTTAIRALAVGSSAWLQTTVTEFDDGDVALRGPIDPTTELEPIDLDSFDCVLADDCAALDAIDAIDACPVVVAIDAASSDCDRVEDLCDAGALDVVGQPPAERPSLLAHRLQRTVRAERERRTTRQRDEWYRTLLEHTSDLVLVVDADGTITFVGPSTGPTGGYDDEALLGTHVLEYVHPDDVATVRTTFETLRADGPGTTATVEYRCRHADGAWYVHRAVLTNRLADGTERSADGIGGIVASIRDVTASHRAEQKLESSLERISDAFYALDSDGRFTYVNEQAADRLDIDPSAALGRRIVDLFPALRETPFHDAALEALRTGDPRTVEHYYEPTDRWYHVRLYPSDSGLSVYFRDVTERVDRERALEKRTERLETLVRNVPVALFVLDGDGTITLAEGHVLDRIDRFADGVVGESVFDVFADHRPIRADSRAALAGQRIHSSVTLADRVFESWYRPIVEDGAVERVIGIAVDVTERAQYQETLNTLHEATSHLLTVESEQAACEYMVDVAADVLDLEAVVYRYDERRNELVPTAYSPALESIVGHPSRLQPDGNTVWRAFVDETAVRFDNVQAVSRAFDRPANAESALYVPIGEHGLLAAYDPEPGRYDDETLELATLFARTAEAALDRISRTRRLHGHEWELERQNAHLEQLHEASQVRQNVEELLLMADSRDEIERGICELLTDLEVCSFAWLGEPDPGGSQLRPQATAGQERGYLDAVTVTAVDDSAAEPAGRAAHTSDPVSVANVGESIRDGAWRGAALSRNFQSVYAVPLVYEGFLYGVLTLYSDDRDAFDDPLRSMLSELGETVGYAIDAVKRKGAMENDRSMVELEFGLEAATPLARLADHLDARVELEGATTRRCSNSGIRRSSSGASSMPTAACFGR
ncbi:PAS domain-containing protein [Natronolimnohabitans innermongolicus]|uniref:PAS domain-containing protein n=1 Tax=Natronolimnohabitans innermongolicus TaxID=253107 RepID=UPI000ADC3855